MKNGTHWVYGFFTHEHKVENMCKYGTVMAATGGVFEQILSLV